MTGVEPSSIERNLERVQERISAAAARSGRDSNSVTLVAVAKTFPAADVVAAWCAGVRDFGENRVEEAMAKTRAVEAALEGRAPRWHMVGHVQSRKAQDVVATFDHVQSVDRVKIARRLSRFTQDSARNLPVLLECNVSGESSKHGFVLDRWQEDAAQRGSFFAAVQEILGLPGLCVQGLMTMAPLVDDPQTVRPVFASLRALLEELRHRLPGEDWRHLSMGMTDDFAVAIEEGATIVRIGRAIFGGRRA